MEMDDLSLPLLCRHARGFPGTPTEPCPAQKPRPGRLPGSRRPQPPLHWSRAEWRKTTLNQRGMAPP